MIRRIVIDNPSCVMLKHEDWPGLEKISGAARFRGRRLYAAHLDLTGNGGLFLDFEMERGADGAMTGLRLPRDAGRRRPLYRGRAERDRGARSLRCPPAAAALRAAAGRRPRRAQICAERRGALASDAQRAPGRRLAAAARAEVDYLLARLARRAIRGRGVKAL